MTVVERYKSQDLEKEDLFNKLDSSRLKIEILERELPEDLFLLERSSSNFQITEEDIREATLKLNPYMEERDLEKSVKNSLSLLEENNFQGSSDFSVVEVSYYDGSKKYFSVVFTRL